MVQTNRAFWEMHRSACLMLAGKDPALMAINADVSFDGTGFWVPSLGKIYRFSYPEYLCTEPMHDWHYLTVLHYLSLADGTPVSGQPVPMAQMPSGMVRGGGYDRLTADALSAFLKGKTECQVLEKFQSLGGERVEGKAELCLKLPFLPRFPLYVNIWFADEEFPPSGRLFVDASAGHYLTIEDAVCVAEVLMDRLK